MEPPSPNIKNYQINDNYGNKYNFSFYINKLGINFEINKLEEIIPQTYINTFDLSSLSNKSKIFSLCNSYNEVFEYINELYKQNKISIKKDNENINIIMKISLMMKEQEVILNLNKKINNKEDIIFQLCDVIKEMKNEILGIKNENNDLKKRILEIENWKKRKEEEDKKRKEEEGRKERRKKSRRIKRIKKRIK